MDGSILRKELDNINLEDVLAISLYRDLNDIPRIDKDIRMRTRRKRRWSFNQ